MPNLDSFLAPDSIAVVGASSDMNKIGAAPIRYLLQEGYKGKIYPVNPNAQRIQDLKSYPSIRAIGAPVQLAIFAIPAHLIESALDDAILADVKSIVIFSAGLAETGPQGAQLQKAITKRARKAGVRLLGPNCLGFMNLTKSVYATFSPVLAMGSATLGHIGMVCQSGAFGAYAYAMARERGVGLSAWITTGNETDISVSDCISWMVDDPQTKVIMAYMEGCNDGVKLRHALSKARLAKKPVIVVKVGRTPLGAITASSHTAALSGEDIVYEAMFKQYGAWRARTIEEFFDIAHCLVTSGMPDNETVGILTVSGGVGVMMADDGEEAGLSLTEMPAHAQELIKEKIPLASTHNPVDVTGQVTSDPNVLNMAARVMLHEGGYGSLLIFLSAFGMDPAMQAMQLQLARDLRIDFPGRPIIFSTLADRKHHTELAQVGSVCFSDPARAIRVLAALRFFHFQFIAKPREHEVTYTGHSNLPHKKYNEAQAMDVLRQTGVPMVDTLTANNRTKAIAKARELGFPIVMKVLSSQIAHKSDVGGVKLNIQNDEQAGTAYDEIRHSLNQAGLTDHIEGVLLAPMQNGGVEMIIGARRDPQLGVIVMLGSGGTHVELLKDIALRLAPVDLEQAHEMISELRAVALLRGFRGALNADINALARAIVQLSEFALGTGQTLESVEVNPFVVFACGQGAIGLDAVLQTRDPS